MRVFQNHHLNISVVESSEIEETFSDTYNPSLEKYPKVEKLSLVTTIKNTTYHGMKNVIDAFKQYNKLEKMIYLNSLDSDLKFLKVLIRVSYKRKYTCNKNYTAWAKKITNIGNLLGVGLKHAKVDK